MWLIQWSLMETFHYLFHNMKLYYWWNNSKCLLKKTNISKLGLFYSSMFLMQKKDIGQLITHSSWSKVKKDCSKGLNIAVNGPWKDTSLDIDVSYFKYQEPLEEYSYSTASMAMNWTSRDGGEMGAIVGAWIEAELLKEEGHYADRWPSIYPIYRGSDQGKRDNWVGGGDKWD